MGHLENESRRCYGQSNSKKQKNGGIQRHVATGCCLENTFGSGGKSSRLNHSVSFCVAELSKTAKCLFNHVADQRLSDYSKNFGAVPKENSCYDIPVSSRTPMKSEWQGEIH